MYPVDTFMHFLSKLKLISITLDVPVNFNSFHFICIALHCIELIDQVKIADFNAHYIKIRTHLLIINDWHELQQMWHKKKTEK